jgi:hypothetical protein
MTIPIYLPYFMAAGPHCHLLWSQPGPSRRALANCGSHANASRVSGHPPRLAFATSIARFSMSPTAPRFDAVAANASVGLQGC